MEIIKGVYTQTVENKKVVQKYVPTEELKLANGSNLGEFLNAQNERIEKLEQDNMFLKQSFATILKAIGGVEDESN